MSASENGQRKAFLRAILDDPGDDTTRLVYADWLEERGDPRGEFIRVQMEKEETAPYEPRYFDLLRREGQLLAAHGDNWRSEVAKWAWEEGGFRRGFLAETACSALKFLRSGKALLRATPLESLRLTSLGEHVGELVASGVLCPLREIHLSAPDVTELCILLLSKGGPEELSVLDVHRARLREEGMAAIVASESLNHLRKLRLSQCQLFDGEVELLSQARFVSTLTTLDLSQNPISDAGLVALSRSPGLSHLRELSLSPTASTSPSSMLKLLRSSAGVGLESLIFSNGWSSERLMQFFSQASDLEIHNLGMPGCRLGSDIGPLLSTGPLAGSLCSLDLRGNPIGDQGCELLRGLSKLRSLSLARCRMNSSGLCRLAASGSLDHLTRLDLRANLFEVDAIRRFTEALPGDSLCELVLSSTARHRAEEYRAIAGCSQFRNLYRLELARCMIGDEGAKALSGSSYLTQLGELDLEANRLGPEGIEALVQSPVVQSLSKLDLSENAIGDKGADAFLRSPFLEGITCLNLRRCEIRQQKKPLQERFGWRVIL